MRHSNRLLLCAILVAIFAITPSCSKKESAQPQASSQAAPAGTSNPAAGPWRMELKLSPNHPSMTKPITFQLHVADGQGQPLNGVQATGSLTMKLMDMGATKLTFLPKGNGDYEATLRSVDMSGPWSVAVDASQGGKRMQQSFDVVVYD